MVKASPKPVRIDLCGRCRERAARDETGVCARCFDPRDLRMSQVFGPTVAIPGSEDKIQIMRRRQELGMPIFLEGDRVLPNVGKREAGDL